MNGNPGNPMANGWVGFWWVGVPAFPYSPGIDVQLPVVPGRDGVRPPGQPDDAGSLLGVLLWLCMQLSVYVGITVCLGVCVCVSVVPERAYIFYQIASFWHGTIFSQ